MRERFVGWRFRQEWELPWCVNNNFSFSSDCTCFFYSCKMYRYSYKMNLFKVLIGRRPRERECNHLIDKGRWKDTSLSNWKLIWISLPAKVFTGKKRLCCSLLQCNLFLCFSTIFSLLQSSQEYFGEVQDQNSKWFSISDLALMLLHV